MKKLAKIFLISCLSLAAIAVAAHLIWKYSGSGEWQLRGTKNGITVYSMKKPGSARKQFKGIARVHSTLPIAMASSMDDQIYTEICKWAGCVGAKVLERVDEQHQLIFFRMNYPFNFRPREFLAAQRLSLVPETKALLVEVTAAPARLPSHDCCFRVEHLNNTWRYTPLKNGELEIEYSVDMDDGGYFPYVLANLGTPEFVAGMLSQMQGILDKERAISPNPKFALLAAK
jgi:hypothetical protein